MREGQNICFTNRHFRQAGVHFLKKKLCRQSLHLGMGRISFGKLWEREEKFAEKFHQVMPTHTVLYSDENFGASFHNTGRYFESLLMCC